ncbi:MAG: acyltransferase [Catonella sp.]|uniref:acyltransferase n=1 Tax=Catonella sp. TaxID=2382125 RepID=UPI003FA094E0
MENIKITELYDLTKTMAVDYLSEFTYPFEALKGISELIIRLGEKLDSEIYEKRGENIWIAKSAKVAPTAFIGSPCIIGENTEVRHGAFIRGSALVGNDCVVGNSVELKNVIIFDSVQVPHYNYVGDSILGFHAHMGAGSITSNVKADKLEVVIKAEGESLATGLKKVGAFLGDYAEIGCNSVLNPGTVIGKNSNVYPLSMVRGVVKENSIYKKQGDIAEKYA